MRKTPKIKFVGLHAHSVAGSPFDGLGYPEEHFEFAYGNGMDAMAITEHGNANSLPHSVLAAKKMNAEGKDFKPIFGVEAYFNPSIKDWTEARNKIAEDKKNKKLIKSDDTGTIVEDENRQRKSILNRRNHLVLLAQNQTGLNNIFTLVSKSFSGENFYRFPRVDYEMLDQHNEGIIATSACLGGIYAGDFWRNKDEGEEAILAAMRDTTDNFLNIFGDRWYGELQWNNIPEQHQVNQYVIKICKEFNISLVSTADSHYPRPELWKDRILYRKLGHLSKRKDFDSYLPKSVEEVGYELYPKNGDDMWESYQRYSKSCNVSYDDDLILKSIERTHEVAHGRIERFYPDSTVRLPDFVVPRGKDATEALVEQSIEGLKQSALDGKQEYIDRLKRELTVINNRGFAKYFLTMKAIADKASSAQLVGAGRGSAAGSLVSYVLGITQVDPIKYDLLFSRFLREDAVDYPDIDYDVSKPMELKEQLAEEWGKNVVVPISNWNTLQLRSLIKDISKFYEVPFKEVNAVTGRMMFEATPKAKKDHGITAGVYTPTFEEVMKYSDSLRKFLKKYPDIKTHVLNLYGQVRSLSRHAGGVVIADNLNQHMPLISSKGVTQTPWSEGQNVRHLEPLGFIKFDILGLASLRMMETCISHILKRHQSNREPSFKDIKEFYDKNIHPDVIDFNDEDIYKNIFHKGKWAGIFQFTEGGAQRFCKQAKPNTIIDIAAITSIYRPGPLSAGVDKKYVEAIGAPQYIKYDHEIIREITEETYGFMIFQEQIALLAHRLGKDISLDEGNTLRKLLTKKGTGAVAKKKEKIRLKFVDGCVEKGLAKNKAEKLWNNIEYFSGYGFNKSHAISYSILSYQCAWLFQKYPVEWMASFLDKEPETRKEKAITIAKNFGFDIEPLNINTSGMNWEILDKNTLVQPLTSIKGLGEAAIQQVLRARPFSNIEDFIFNENIVYSKLNKKALDVLCRSQTLNCLVDERFSGLKHFWSAVAVDRAKTKRKFHTNIELFYGEGDFTEEEKIEYLVDLTGLFPIHKVVGDEMQKDLEGRFVLPISDYDEELQLVWFIPRELIAKKTRNDKDFYIMNVIDSNSQLTSVKCWGVSPQRDVIHINRPYMARVKYDEQWGFSINNIRKNMILLG
jgi:DNA polymerase III subunit alpha